MLRKGVINSLILQKCLNKGFPFFEKLFCMCTFGSNCLQFVHNSVSFSFRPGDVPDQHGWVNPSIHASFLSSLYPDCIYPFHCRTLLRLKCPPINSHIIWMKLRGSSLTLSAQESSYKNRQRSYAPVITKENYANIPLINDMLQIYNNIIEFKEYPGDHTVTCVLQFSVRTRNIARNSGIF